MKINHIFFDLDHTLWDFERNSDLAFETIFNKHELDIDLNQFFSFYRDINQQYWKMFREERVSKSDLRYGRLKDTFDKMNKFMNDDLINTLAVDYIDELPNNNYLFDNVHEVLEKLKLNYRLHIITNGFNEVQHKKIINSKLEPYFDKIITSEEVGVKKPNPKIFEYALEKAGASTNSSVMIGDNLEADILGAKSIGLDVIYVNFNEIPSPNGIKSVNNLKQLFKYL